MTVPLGIKNQELYVPKRNSSEYQFLFQNLLFIRFNSITPFTFHYRLKEVQKQLAEEQEISRALQNNQSSWHSKYKQLELNYKDYKETKESELDSIKEQLRDIMFYMQAQSQIAESELKDEIVGGTVVVPESNEQPSTSKGNRRKKKH